MIFTRHRLIPRGHLDHEPPPCTWDYLDADPSRPLFAHDLALCTCPKGHTCRMVDTVHRIDAAGVTLPSYVCPVEGCGFHEYVQLVGWEAERKS